MDQRDARFNRRLALLVLASFAVFALAVALRLGIGATPYAAADSAGRPMGFNDPLSAEHYLIMLRNFHPTDFLRREYIYAWVLLAAHVLGAGLLLSCGPVCRRVTRIFFALQPVLFPFWIPAALVLRLIEVDFLSGRMDREGFVDIPFILIVTHPIWVGASLFIAFSLRGKGLGLARLWNAITRKQERLISSATPASGPSISSPSE